MICQYKAVLERSQTIGAFMTHPARVVGPSDTVSEAREVMQTYGIRHLPVVYEGRLKGVLSISDLYAAEAIVEVNPDATLVEQLMATDLYTVAPTALLADVVEVMAERHLGSALVVEDEQLLGIFTTLDACRTLALLLRYPTLSNE